MKEGQSTPWGPAQTVAELAPGIYSVSTAGHGGVHLDYEHAAKMPKDMVYSSFLNSNNWFEEDCDWCLPFVVFQDEILAAEQDTHSAKVINDNIHVKSFKMYHPESFEKFYKEGKKA